MEYNSNIVTCECDKGQGDTWRVMCALRLRDSHMGICQRSERYIESNVWSTTLRWSHGNMTKVREIHRE